MNALDAADHVYDMAGDRQTFRDWFLQHWPAGGAVTGEQVYAALVDTTGEASRTWHHLDPQQQDDYDRAAARLSAPQPVGSWSEAWQHALDMTKGYVESNIAPDKALRDLYDYFEALMRCDENRPAPQPVAFDVEAVVTELCKGWHHPTVGMFADMCRKVLRRHAAAPAASAEYECRSPRILREDIATAEVLHFASLAVTPRFDTNSAAIKLLAALNTPHPDETDSELVDRYLRLWMAAPAVGVVSELTPRERWLIGQAWIAAQEFTSTSVLEWLAMVGSDDETVEDALSHHAPPLTAPLSEPAPAAQSEREPVCSTAYRIGFAAGKAAVAAPVVVEVTGEDIDSLAGAKWDADECAVAINARLRARAGTAGHTITVDEHVDAVNAAKAETLRQWQDALLGVMPVTTAAMDLTTPQGFAQAVQCSFTMGTGAHWVRRPEGQASALVVPEDGRYARRGLGIPENTIVVMYRGEEVSDRILAIRRIDTDAPTTWIHRTPATAGGWTDLDVAACVGQHVVEQYEGTYSETHKWADDVDARYIATTYDANGVVAYYILPPVEAQP